MLAILACNIVQFMKMCKNVKRVARKSLIWSTFTRGYSTKGAFSVQFYFDRDQIKSKKNDRQIYLSYRQSTNRVKYLPVVF